MRSRVVFTTILQGRCHYQLHRHVGSLAQGAELRNGRARVRTQARLFRHNTRRLHCAEKKNEIRTCITGNGTRNRPLKENCSYFFNWTVGSYQSDPHCQGREPLPAGCGLLAQKAEDPNVQSCASLPSLAILVKSGLCVL